MGPALWKDSATNLNNDEVLGRRDGRERLLGEDGIIPVARVGYADELVWPCPCRNESKLGTKEHQTAGS